MFKALTLPLLVTLFFHGLLLAILLIDAPEAQPLVKKMPTKYIQAELVTLDKPKAPASKPEQAKPADGNETKKLAEQKKQQELQRQKKAEQERLAKLEQQKAEQARQKQAEQKQKELEQQRQQQRQQQERERLQKQAEQEFTDAIEKEKAQRRAETDAELASSLVALITETIQNNWSRPPSARNNMEAELAIQLVPTGEVVSVSVVHSSGNAAFDRSAETAVLKAERFPEMQKIPSRVFEQYFRRLHLKFKPEDLRL